MNAFDPLVIAFAVIAMMAICWIASIDTKVTTLSVRTLFLERNYGEWKTRKDEAEAISGNSVLYVSAVDLFEDPDYEPD